MLLPMRSASPKMVVLMLIKYQIWKEKHTELRYPQQDSRHSIWPHWHLPGGKTSHR